MANIASLIARQQQLMQQDKLINECLQLIRAEKNKLQIEQLQLESMLTNLNGELLKTKTSFIQPTKEPLKPFELDGTNINKEEIDLNIMSSLDRMLEGQFFTESEDEIEELSDGI